MIKPVIGVFDDFLDHPMIARAAVMRGEFGDFKSDLDGVTYPNISIVSDAVRETFVRRLESMLGRCIDPVAVFARATYADTVAPHKVHSDKIMGFYSAHVYLSLAWPDGTGTGFYQHKTEGTAHTCETDLSNLDLKSLANWQQHFGVQGRFNRLLLHDASLWHSAAGAWGDKPENARVVLTCFFN